MSKWIAEFDLDGGTMPEHMDLNYMGAHIDFHCRPLEQEPILNKIRAEIVEEMLSHSGTGEEVIQAYADGLKKGLDILDKYKAESEE